jgi:hypothetical protein
MQYRQRKLQRSVTDTRTLRIGRPQLSRNEHAAAELAGGGWGR